MTQVAKSTNSSRLAEAVDRILEKDIVVGAWAKISPVAIELLSLEARVVIVSVGAWEKVKNSKIWF
jgi:phosphosulfolactate phosphohydrolase-like enzyme